MAFSARFVSIARLSYFLATLAMLGLAVLALGLFMLPELARTLLVNNAPQGLNIAAPPSTFTVYILLLVGCISVAVQLFVLWHMRCLFALYAEGEALSRSCATHISRVGFGLLIYPVAGVLYYMASSVLLTMGNAAGERELAIGFSSFEIAGALGGAMLILIGSAMQEASRQAEENRAFV